MTRFVSYDKLSKRQRREIDQSRRGSWQGVNPVTRRSKDPKAYDRNKARAWKKEPDGAFFVRGAGGQW